MCEPVEKRGGHLGVAEDGGPFTEGQIGGDDDRGSLIEPADQMEEKLAASLSEREIAEFVHDDEVEPSDEVGEPALLSDACLCFETIDEIDDIVEPAPCAVTDQGTGNGD